MHQKLHINLQNESNVRLCNASCGCTHFELTFPKHVSVTQHYVCRLSAAAGQILVNTQLKQRVLKCKHSQWAIGILHLSRAVVHTPLTHVLTIHSARLHQEGSTHLEISKVLCCVSSVPLSDQIQP